MRCTALIAISLLLLPAGAQELGATNSLKSPKVATGGKDAKPASAISIQTDVKHGLGTHAGAAAFAATGATLPSGKSFTGNWAPTASNTGASGSADVGSGGSGAGGEGDAQSYVSITGDANGAGAGFNGDGGGSIGTQTAAAGNTGGNAGSGASSGYLSGGSVIGGTTGQSPVYLGIAPSNANGAVGSGTSGNSAVTVGGGSNASNALAGKFQTMGTVMTAIGDSITGSTGSASTPSTSASPAIENAVPVPEPGTMLLFAAGAGLLVRRQRKERKITT